ncbi:MAG: hypothetical protein ACRED9_15180 [Caulobacteraceae bacterium]
MSAAAKGLIVGGFAFAFLSGTALAQSGGAIATAPAANQPADNPSPPPAASPNSTKADAEPLPAGAPTDPYQLSAWCYGAMGEWISIYDRIKPQLRAIDKLFGTSEPHEAEPYQSDMAAARVELKALAQAVEAAEQASPNPIAPEGLEAIKQGRAIWIPAEMQPPRRLADAWLTWAMPDKCDSTARALTARSRLLGKALTYNEGPSAPAQAAPPATPAPSGSFGGGTPSANDPLGALVGSNAAPAGATNAETPAASPGAADQPKSSDTDLKGDVGPK